jgi:hypothetical protein
MTRAASAFFVFPDGLNPVQAGEMGGYISKPFREGRKENNLLWADIENIGTKRLRPCPETGSGHSNLLK